MKKLAAIRDEIKAGKKYSTLAQLVSVYIEMGITSTRAIAEATGKSERQIWRAKADIRDTDKNDTLTNTSVSKASVTMTHTSSDPDIGDSGKTSRAHAYKENPTGLNISSSKLASSAPMREIEGLNGSTTMWVEKLANWLAGDLGTPDLATARTLIESSVDCYGPQQVKIGMLELEAKIASGEKFRNLASGFSRFVKNAKPASATSPQNRKQAEADKSRRFDELLESMEFSV